MAIHLTTSPFFDRTQPAFDPHSSSSGIAPASSRFSSQVERSEPEENNWTRFWKPIPKRLLGINSFNGKNVLHAAERCLYIDYAADGLLVTAAKVAGYILVLPAVFAFVIKVALRSYYCYYPFNQETYGKVTFTEDLRQFEINERRSLCLELRSFEFRDRERRAHVAVHGLRGEAETRIEAQRIVRLVMCWGTVRQQQAARALMEVLDDTSEAYLAAVNGSGPQLIYERLRRMSRISLYVMAVGETFDLVSHIPPQPSDPRNTRRTEAYGDEHLSAFSDEDSDDELYNRATPSSRRTEAYGDEHLSALNAATDIEDDLYEQIYGHPRTTQTHNHNPVHRAPPRETKVEKKVDPLPDLNLLHAQQMVKVIEYINNNFICPISQDILDDPRLTPCGHTFEAGQILHALKGKKQCPVDRRSVAAHQIFSNLFVKTLLDLKIRVIFLAHKDQEKNLDLKELFAKVAREGLDDRKVLTQTLAKLFVDPVSKEPIEEFKPPNIMASQLREFLSGQSFKEMQPAGEGPKQGVLLFLKGNHTFAKIGQIAKALGMVSSSAQTCSLEMGNKRVVLLDGQTGIRDQGALSDTLPVLTNASRDIPLVLVS